MIRERVANWPLQRQLMMVLGAVLITVILAIGIISIGQQRADLLRRLDDQLGMSLELARPAAPSTPPESGGAPTNPDPLGPGQPGTARLGSLSIRTGTDGVVMATIITDDGAIHDLTDSEVATVAEAVEGRDDPVDVGLEYGSYRVQGKTELIDGAEQTTIIGQSLSDVWRTTTNLLLVYGMTSLLGTSAAVIVTRLLVKNRLMPLDQLQQTATKVASLPLASGTATIATRVPSDILREGTEVGKVGVAFNIMLDHVESSLHARQNSEDKLRRFVADASHELRTPLAAVSGYAELASRGSTELPEETQRCLFRIRSESQRMTDMVEDLLLLAKLDAGVAINHDLVSPTDVVITAVADAMVLDGDKDYVLDFGDEMELIEVRGDADRLHQVLMNILRNAQQHTPGGTRITVTVNQPDPRSVTVSIADNGPGISPTIAEKVFDRFVREDVSRSRQTGSTGLGMAIAQAIIHAHHGTISLDTGPHGTTFTVTLPVAA